VLLEAHHRQSKAFQLDTCFGVALTIARELRVPISLVRRRLYRALRASVSEAAVDKDRDPSPREDYVRAGTQLENRASINPVSESRGV
jgi:hypothetical protein